MEKEITLKYSEELTEKIWEVIEKENLWRYDNRRIYLDNILDSIDKIQAIIEKKGRYDGQNK